MSKLVVISKSQASPGVCRALGKNWVTIGRSPGNAFQIVESSISGQHCEVLLRGNELLVRDMRSTNGTFIKEKMVTEGVLRKGEVLRLGEIELRLEVSDTQIIPLSIYGSRQNGAAHEAAAAPSLTTVDFGMRRHQVLLVDDSMAFLEMAGEMFEMFAN